MLFFLCLLVFLARDWALCVSQTDVHFGLFLPVFMGRVQLTVLAFGTVWSLFGLTNIYSDLNTRRLAVREASVMSNQSKPMKKTAFFIDWQLEASARCRVLSLL
jgi:hypothetical protein